MSDVETSPAPSPATLVKGTPKKAGRGRPKSKEPKAPKAPKPPKAKKPAKPAPSHPPLAELVIEAVGALAEKKGSSLIAIIKYIAENYKEVDTVRQRIFIRKSLLRTVEAGTLIQYKGTTASGSFKLPKEMPKKEKKVKATKPKKPAAKKTKKKTPKKPAAKKATTPKKGTPKKATPVKGTPKKAGRGRPKKQ